MDKEMSETPRDHFDEVWDLIGKFNMWMEESHKELVSTIDSYNARVNKGFHILVQEFQDLQAKRCIEETDQLYEASQEDECAISWAFDLVILEENVCTE